MSLVGIVAAGRRAAESLMTTQVTVTRPGPLVEQPDGTVAPSQTTVYTGKAKLQSYEGYESNPEAGGHVFTEQRMSLHFPVGSFAMQVGDEAVITGSTDPLLIERRFRLVQVAPFKEHATAYRTFVEEVTA